MERKELAHNSIRMFRRVDTMLRRYLDRKVCHTGVYPTQHRLLMELYRNPNCSQVGLAEKFDVSAAAIAVSLKKLEKGGYITRLADEADNRINQVSVTEKGKEVIHKSFLIFEETDRCLRMKKWRSFWTLWNGLIKIWQMRTAAWTGRTVNETVSEVREALLVCVYFRADSYDYRGGR